MDAGCLPQSLSTILLFEAGPLSEPRACPLLEWPSRKPRKLPVSASPVQQLQELTSAPSFFLFL